MLETILLDALVAMIIISPVVLIIGWVISIGNERQRKELARIHHRRPVGGPALRMKRAKLSADVNVSDPKAWCNDLVARVLQFNPEFTVEASLTKPDALVMHLVSNPGFWRSRQSPRKTPSSSPGGPPSRTRRLPCPPTIRCSRIRAMPT